MKIHFISGLGADERVFRFLNLPDTEKVFLKWEVPNPTESIKSYSKRLLQQIEQDEAVILVGVSFGGIIAQEIAKLIPCKKIIIISSIKSAKELSWQSILIKRTRVYKLFTPEILKRTNAFASNYFFSIKARGESLLLRQIVQETSAEFLKWAITEIMIWDNKNINDNLVHIHGTSDRIFPYHSIKNCIPVKAGGHFMIVNRAEEINRIILQVLT